jgi:small-conductance mechanosensitive channel/CRP-like cAMP-binding protein
MDELARALDGASGEAVALGTTLVLLALAAAIVPSAERRSLRLPAGFLIAHLLFESVDRLFGPASRAGRVFALLSFATLGIAIGRAGLALVLDGVLGRQLARPLPKIIRDIVHGLVYFFVALGVLREIGFEPGQLLTTSALLTAVIGLSLQETLGNLVAGLSVQMQPPFVVGDWIQYENDPRSIGRVIESNWRATTLRTLDEVDIIVPNGLLSKAALRNHSRPTAVTRRGVVVIVGYDVPPGRVREALLSAATGSPGVLPQPEPSVVLQHFGDSGIEYWLRYFIDNFPERDRIDGSVRERIWYGFQRANIRIPYPHRRVLLQQQSEETLALEQTRLVDRCERALERVDVLRVLTPEQRRRLAERGTSRLFSPGEIIVRQGDDADELFVVLAGEVAVVLASSSSEKEISRLTAGEFFGEMALVTGERRKATVKAATECELVAVGHDAFERVLRETPEVATELSRVLAERQLTLDAEGQRLSIEARAAVVDEEQSRLLASIRRFFSLRSG